MSDSPTLLSSPRPDRRVNRSNISSEALMLALSAAAARNDVEAIVVADDAGWLMAASDPSRDLTPWAAATPFLAAAKGTPSLRADGEEEQVGVHTVRVAGEPLHVGVVGGTLTARGQALTACGEAVRRILTQRAA